MVLLSAEGTFVPVQGHEYVVTTSRNVERSLQGLEDKLVETQERLRQIAEALAQAPEMRSQPQPPASLPVFRSGLSPLSPSTPGSVFCDVLEAAGHMPSWPSLVARAPNPNPGSPPPSQLPVDPMSPGSTA
eukprot:NODE_4597_length_645_cov_25.701342_g3939_i0.p2 GENE.NODE_4597_length_645_cov_25.701342_g3939_i0~~NODE_4597_length_645_cov_25.701342_g3939_i0.p2  ORF type:complete len:144 (-),score=42.16 NODE_4597_length_645_cov_25.701342_g3939_i0:214-606(-)